MSEKTAKLIELINLFRKVGFASKINPYICQESDPLVQLANEKILTKCTNGSNEPNLGYIRGYGFDKTSKSICHYCYQNCTHSQGLEKYYYGKDISQLYPNYGGKIINCQCQNCNFIW